MNKTKPAIMELPAHAPRLAIVVIVILLVSTGIVFLSLVLVDQLSGPKSRLELLAVDSVQASKEFRPGQAVTIETDTVSVHVPPLAIPLPGSIFIIQREPDQYLIVSQREWSHPQVIEVQFLNVEGAPTEIALSSPIKICFKLTETQWQYFAEHPESYELQYYALNSDLPIWLRLPMTIHPDLPQLCGWTDHLSVFALAIKSEPFIPVTGPSATPSPTPTPTSTTVPFQPSPTNLYNRSVPSFTPTLTSTPVPTNTPLPTATNTPLPTSTRTRTPLPTSTPTRTPLPTSTRTRTPLPTSTPTRTPLPTSTPTRTPPPTATPLPTATNPPPTATPLPTATPRPPTATVPPPTATDVPPTATDVPPTATDVPPTATDVPPPTATDVPPTDIPPTNPPPPTNTEPPPPTSVP